MINGGFVMFGGLEKGDWASLKRATCKVEASPYIHFWSYRLNKIKFAYNSENTAYYNNAYILYFQSGHENVYVPKHFFESLILHIKALKIMESLFYNAMIISYQILENSIVLLSLETIVEHGNLDLFLQKQRQMIIISTIHCGHFTFKCFLRIVTNGYLAIN